VRLLAVALLAAAGAAGAQLSDWEREQKERAWREREVVLPAYPKREALIPFFVSATTESDFFVDGASLSAGDDGVVRYTLVARSRHGAESVSYEGIRCSSGEYRMYATGAGGTWTRRELPWRKIEPRSIQRWHNALEKEYFCPLGVPIRSAAEGVDALRRGHHPSRRPSGD
jgi:hypothetical protein